MFSFIMGDKIDYIKHTIKDMILPEAYVEHILKMGESEKNRIMQAIPTEKYVEPTKQSYAANPGPIDSLADHYGSKKKKHGFF